MNRHGRMVALGILVVTMLVAHGLMAPVAYTFAFGRSGTAEILSCHVSGKSGTVCRGRWEESGEPVEGTVSGAGSSDEGSPVAIRTSALGTYTDNFQLHFWPRSIMAVAVDAGLVAVLVWIRRLRQRGAQAVERLRADSDASTQLFALESKTISELGGAPYYTTDDVDSRTSRLVDGLGNTAWTFTGETLSDGTGRITLSRNGTGHGYLEGRRTSPVTYLHNPQGEPVATITHQRHYGVPGFTFGSLDGRQLALTMMGGRKLVARIPREAPEWWRHLVFAHMAVGNWLTTPRLHRKPQRP